MKDEVFNIDFRKLAIEWLPTFNRMSVFTAIVLVMIAPVELLFNEFLKARKQNLIRLKTTCQKFSMQKRLNDIFDPLERRIEIVKAVLFDEKYLYTEAEDDQFKTKTKWLFGDENPIYLYTEAELYSDFDFLVKIPNSGINELQLKAEIEYYMLQSKQYKIQIV
ncbi:hypothetical protein AB670_02748 [Chryseobacterium sp. MOF25P]|uniref:hypothetical protein n=1 Tax=unclassified Chryseobacterium TaxID=2593645 RepID=UPI0008059449|nr:MULTISPECIES: hypothetical protein [unclassified Chryseobacterium]OBW40797.1 hypothetical protein AB670_02748 [Chryseobacterium sp. MOF25P]OBW45261.1 hypothetical protein AB671_02558 [Chryseobacterium sp. BGARF1]